VKISVRECIIEIPESQICKTFDFTLSVIFKSILIDSLRFETNCLSSPQFLPQDNQASAGFDCHGKSKSAFRVVFGNTIGSGISWIFPEIGSDIPNMACK